MNMNAGQWRKIYLFYGAIFFSLGLLGLLCSADLWEPIAYRTAGYLETLRAYSDLPRGGPEEITVFQSRFPGEVVLFYQASLNPFHGRRIHQMKTALSGFFQKTTLMAVHPEDNLPLAMLDSGEIAVKECIGIRPGKRGEAEVFFNLPKAAEADLVHMVMAFNLPGVRLQKLIKGKREIFRLCWLSAGEDPGELYPELLESLFGLRRSANAAKI